MYLALTRLHYGADYLKEVICSTAHFAEKHIVLYTPAPSEGFKRTDLVCPDSRETLFNIAHTAGQGRVEWHDDLPIDVTVGRKLYPAADLLLELDADEIPDVELLTTIDVLFRKGKLTHGRYYLNFVHYWRSFQYACRGGDPHRLYVYRGAQDNAVTYLADWPHGAIHHFGYARSLTDMRYKLATSAHRDEFVPNWWDDVFMQFPKRLHDLHPITPSYWQAQPISSRQLPEGLLEHPYMGRRIIE